ncbi:magnesium/cobalt transporter CorA [Methylomagnum sp.]
MPPTIQSPPINQGDIVINCVAYKEGHRFGDIEIEDISEVLKDKETFVWLGLRGSNLDMLAKIQQEFGLHELAIEDTRSAHQRPKLEEYGDSVFVVLHPAHLIDGSVQFGETHLFVGQRFLVSVRHGPFLGYQRVRERCESMPRQLAKGPGFALYSIIDYIVDNYVPVVDGLNERFEQLEAEIFRHRIERETLEDLYELKRELLMLRAATCPLLDICNGLMRFHPDIIPKDVQPYFRDISDHVKRIDQAIDGMREMLTAAMQVHLSLVTVRQNEVVKRLAGWGAILALPTMVFSLYGMNFKHMPELEWPMAYPGVMGGVVAGCVLLYFKLKRVGWL